MRMKVNRPCDTPPQASTQLELKLDSIRARDDQPHFRSWKTPSKTPAKAPISVSWFTCFGQQWAMALLRRHKADSGLGWMISPGGNAGSSNHRCLEGSTNPAIHNRRFLSQ